VVKLSEILTLSPEDERRIHPHALKRFNDWRADILREVPLAGEYSIDEFNADLSIYLDDEEKARAMEYKAQIGGWLRKCIDLGDWPSPYPYSTWVVQSMSELKRLVKIAYERKVVKAEDEQRKREEEERWRAAYVALKLPLQDAKMVLDAGEYNEFERSISGAVDAYLAKGKDYLRDSRAYDYSRWCNRINSRQKEKALKIAAENKSWEFNRSLNEEIRRLRLMLYAEKQKAKDYFEERTADLRYTGQSFVHLLADDEKQAFDTAVRIVAREKLGKLVPDAFYRFIDWEYWISYFLLPWADYSFEGVPCLDFSFDAFAVVEAKVWLKPEQKSFGGYIFTLPQIQHKCDPYGSYFTELKEPEFLGYHYLVLTPSDLGYTFWQSIPLVLIQGLMNGELEPAGTTIVEASEAETNYRISNLTEGVNIPVVFADYLKEIGGIDSMVSIGILSKKVANIVGNRLGQLGVEQKSNHPQNGQATCFSDEELISSLTALGVPMKDAKNLVELTPRSSALPEAIKLALQKYSEIIAQ